MRLNLSLKQQFGLLLVLVACFPFLGMKLSFDIQNQQLNRQMSDDLQNTLSLSLLLSLDQNENQLGLEPTDYWAHRLSQLHQTLGLDPKQQAIWLLNDQGQVFYVYGWLDQHQPKGLNKLWQSILIKWHPFYQKSPLLVEDAVNTLVEQSLAGLPAQAIRRHGLFPASLMTSAPLVLGSTGQQPAQQGVIIFEQTLSHLIKRSLGSLYSFLIGLMLLLVVWNLLLIVIAGYASWRIRAIQSALKQGIRVLFKDNRIDYLSPKFKINDEIQQLNDDILALFNQLSDYQRHLTQLPDMLNHELHNPLNRLNLALAQLPLTADQKRPLVQAIGQITLITQSLTAAKSLKHSIENARLQPVNLATRLHDYFTQVVDFIGKDKVVFNAFKTNDLWVMADAFLLEQLFDKLIDNALVFNDGTCPIQITCILESAHNRLVISLCNCGPGWPKGVDLRNEFVSVNQPILNQAQQLRHTSPHLGLGLYLADLIAKRHQGELKLTEFRHATDTLATGVCVTLVLPLIDDSIVE